MMTPKVIAINGPVVKADQPSMFSILEKVLVGPRHLIGEVISVNEKQAIIQVYESTTGLKTGDEIVATGEPISVNLGPGLLGNIFDGIERPLKRIAHEMGIYINAGSSISPLDETKRWDVTFTVKANDTVSEGQVFATVSETSSITHRLLIPFGLSGKVTRVSSDGAYTLADPVLDILTPAGNTVNLTMMQHWPIHKPRPSSERLPLSRPLVTGQRVVDTLFPIAKGGTAAVPGGFGAGKTMLQHQLAKWCDADIIVYIGCGERGNEMTQALEEFQSLEDPRTHKSLMERTVLIANTSNMPVAAREASIYTGLTIAEYYRDMGYDVAVMADSTSRWAEALREISGRLEEMPAEEGFPAYLPSRLSQFYERSGLVKNLNGTHGSVTIIGAVSPQGADFSEPVTQATKRFVRCFWALDKNLSYQRHFPAVNWNQSYSEYIGDLSSWFNQNVGTSFLRNRARVRSILSEEDQLMEIVRLIGSDVLPDDQKIIIETGRAIRLGFLQQNAFHAEDTYVPLAKQQNMMDTILYLHDQALRFIARGKALSLLLKTGIFDTVIKMKYEIKNDDAKAFADLKEQIDTVIASLA